MSERNGSDDSCDIDDESTRTAVEVSLPQVSPGRPGVLSGHGLVVLRVLGGCVCFVGVVSCHLGMAESVCTLYIVQKCLLTLQCVHLLCRN